MSQYRTYLLIKPSRLVKFGVWMMEKRFTCLVEITAVLSVLGLTFQVQGGATIGDWNLIFCTLSFMRDDDQLLRLQREEAIND